MTAKNDIMGIRRVIRTLKRAGWNLDSVYDGEENIPVRTEAAAIEAITAVDEAWLYVNRSSERGWCFFVLGNGGEDPVEVLNDFTVNLTILETLY